MVTIVVGGLALVISCIVLVSHVNSMNDQIMQLQVKNDDLNEEIKWLDYKVHKFDEQLGNN